MLIQTVSWYWSQTEVYWWLRTDKSHEFYLVSLHIYSPFSYETAF
jgi:hypothetical protein